MFQRDAMSTFSSILTGFVIHASAFVSVICTDTSSIFLCRVSENWCCPWVEGCPRCLCLCKFLRQLSNQKKKLSSLSTFYEGGCEFLVSFYFLFLRFSGVFPPSTLNMKIYVFQVPILSMKLDMLVSHLLFCGGDLDPRPSAIFFPFILHPLLLDFTSPLKKAHTGAGEMTLHQVFARKRMWVSMPETM